MSDKKNLTAGELIEALKALDPATLVFVRGYEDGVNYVTEVKPITVELFAYTEWYYGEHDEAPSYKTGEETVQGVEIVGEHVREQANS